jgi:hypothetical protein
MGAPARQRTLNGDGRKLSECRWTIPLGVFSTPLRRYSMRSAGSRCLLAERLRGRACHGPQLTPEEAMDTQHELAAAREGVAVLEGQVALFRQDLRPM